MIRHIRRRTRLWRRIRLALIVTLVTCVVLVPPLLLLLPHPAARPAPPPPPPSIEARQVPLHPGDWHELARVTEEAEAAAVLVRLDGRDADAAVLVRVNRLGRKVGWGQSPPCLSRDYEPSRVLHASDHDGFCVYASYVDGTGPQTGVAIDAAWRQAMQAAVDRGWNVPPHLAVSHLSPGRSVRRHAGALPVPSLAGE